MKEWKLQHYVAFSLAMVILYSIAEFIVGCFGVSHDTLTTYFFACFGGEVLCTALIKIFKLRDKNDTSDDVLTDICDEGDV